MTMIHNFKVVMCDFEQFESNDLALVQNHHISHIQA